MKELTVAEEIILTAILRLEDNAYGVAIRKKVAEVTQKEFIYGTLYNLLDQLVRKGYVSKNRGAPTPERGGRSKIYYALTPSGVEALQGARSLHKKIWEGLPDLAVDKG
ncbi:MAG: PadR family transcriptional regulator [Candidatus Aminicenantaceae bacterium]